MTGKQELYCSISYLAIIALYGLVIYKKIQPSIRVIVILISITVLEEIIAFYTTIRYQTNTQVYHVYNALEFIIIGFYFDRVLNLSKKNFVAVSVCILSILALIINITFFQPWTILNSNFMLFEGFCTIALCLLALTRMFIDKHELYITRNPDFWMCLIFLFYWCSTYFSWALYNMVAYRKLPFGSFLGDIILVVNLLAYAGMGIAFYLSARKKRIYE